MVKRYFNKLNMTEFKKNVLLMGTSTIFAQSVMLLFTPFLTRVYGAENFGIFSLFISSLSILLPLTTFRYDQAIMISKSNAEAVIGLNSASILSIISSSLSVVLFVCFFDFLSSFSSLAVLLSVEGIALYLFIYMISNSLYFVFRSYHNRLKNFKLLSIIKIIENLLFASFVVLYFFSNLITVNEILISRILALSISTIILFLLIKDSFQIISFNDLVIYLKRFKNFPIYTVPSELLNQGINQLPVFFIATKFGVDSAGFFALTQRVLSMPLNFIGLSLLEVFKEKATFDFHETGGNKVIFKKVLISLIMVGTPLSFLLYVFGESLFQYFFGEEWAVSGKLASLLAFTYLFKVVSSPLAYTLTISEKQNIGLYLSIIYFISCYLSFDYGDTLIESVSYYSCISLIMYFLLIVISYRYTKKNKI